MTAPERNLGRRRLSLDVADDVLEFHDLLKEDVRVLLLRLLRDLTVKACPLPLLQGTPHFGENFRGLVLGCMGTYDSEREREREAYMSDFARPTKNSHVREKARLGMPMGFTHWSSKECTFIYL